MSRASCVRGEQATTTHLVTGSVDASREAVADRVVAVLGGVLHTQASTKGVGRDETSHRQRTSSDTARSSTKRRKRTLLASLDEP